VTRTETSELADRILALLEFNGARAYLGEPVTQLEHALQTAALAESSQASDSLVVAALLHDVGHLLPGPAGHTASPGADARHEDVGDQWLSGQFSRAVTEPIRLHVAAKRYLCAVDPDYAASLSAASQESLARQGAAMDQDEVRMFNQTPWANEAVALRRWDDAAKVPGLEVPGVSHYRARVQQLLDWRP
jgi:[1-hydroxy-2-(trimethylamino)ethyl]phosphonate dioxygenase